MMQKAFTLIELSIVLVIVGLVVGSVLVGRDLVKAAEVRAQISQFERYHHAVNTFQGKYGYLPGDIKDPDASNFGFVARGAYAGTGDANGVIEGIGMYAAGQNYGFDGGSGETILFWRDLSQAKLVTDGAFSTAVATSVPIVTGTFILNYLPRSKMGSQYSFIQVNSGGGRNYYTWHNLDLMLGGWAACNTCLSNQLTVSEAYQIDSKIDDGLPGGGGVFAASTILGGDIVWLVGTSGPSIPTSAMAGTSTSCYDNNNTNGAMQQYSINQNNGNGRNCSLLIRFK